MAVTIWSIELDPQSTIDFPDAPVAGDLVVEIRRKNSEPSWHQLRAAAPIAIRRPESPSRRLRVRRLPV